MTSLHNREFRALAATEVLSIVGDQLSRVALVVLVFDRTQSAGLSGLTYALTYLPTVAGGLLLSGQADRRPRRDVSVAIDAIRAAIVLAMAVPGVPLALLCGLIATSSFLSGPHTAARLALLRDVLPQEQFGAGTALRQQLSQGGQVLGFCAGGFVATAFDPATCLIIDGLTFSTAAVVVRVFVRPRPAVVGCRTASSVGRTLHLIWRFPPRRAIFLSTFMGLFLTAPASLSAPLVAELGLDTHWVGLFMAAEGLFSVVALMVFVRFVPADRYTRVFPLACVAPGLPLLVAFLVHDPYLVILVFGLSGALWSGLVVIAVSSFAEMLPDDQRGQGMGIAGSMNATSQGVGAFISGLVAQRLGCGATITLGGSAGVLFALAVAALWNRPVSADTMRVENGIIQPRPEGVLSENR